MATQGRAVARLVHEESKPWLSPPREPFLRRGAPEPWRELSKVTPAWLKQRFPDVRVAAYESGFEQRRGRRGQTTIGRYIDHMIERRAREAEGIPDASGDLYMGEDPELCGIFGIEDAVRAYVEPLLPRLRVRELMAFWIGPKGSYTGLHGDPDGLNLLILLEGSKSFYILPPEVGARIPPSERYDWGAVTSSLDVWPEGPGACRGAFPVEGALHFRMEAGDVLYIPRLWWHAVENHEDTLAISYRMETPLTLLSNLGVFAKLGLHNLGLYRRNNCTCHPEDHKLEVIL